MIKTTPHKTLSRFDQKLTVIKKIASNAVMGIFSLLFIIGFATFYFLFAPLDRQIAIPAIIFTLIAIGMLAQTIAALAPLLLELWRQETIGESDELLFP